MDEIATKAGSAHIEVDFHHRSKHGQRVAGDVFASRRLRGEDRVVSILSDGLGSGVKASVLATLTATMGLKYASSFQDIRKSAETIMDTLPVCRVRKISYSTFTIADVDGEGDVRLIEHGNPRFLLLRGASSVEVPLATIELEHWQDRPLSEARFRLELGDRLVMCSDGVTQSGMGNSSMPLGWGGDAMRDFVCQLIAAEPQISARRLSDAVVERALQNDNRRARDDISCAVIYFRRPRRLLLASGPPFARERDAELASLVSSYPGRRAISGGTTAAIVGRVLGRPVILDLDADLASDLPPLSRMEGIDLVTEGTITLARALELLESDAEPRRDDPAGRLMELLLDSDIIDLVIGTRVNEAHHDPSLPVELDLRRNIVKKLVAVLETRHLKKTKLRFM